MLKEKLLPEFLYAPGCPLWLISDKINRPSLFALGDWFLLRAYVSTSQASPNDSKIVIIVIIIEIGEAKWVPHIGGIIAQFQGIYQF